MASEQGVSQDGSHTQTQFRWFLDRLGGSVVVTGWVNHPQVSQTRPSSGTTAQANSNASFLVGWDQGGQAIAIEEGSGRVVIEEPGRGQTELSHSFQEFLVMRILSAAPAANLRSAEDTRRQRTPRKG